MFGPFSTFFASLFSAELYQWASHMRRGIGLSYVFGIALITTLSVTLYCLYNFGTNWMTLIAVENNILPADIRVYFSVIIPNEILVLFVLPTIFCILLTLAFFNLAIITSVTIGQAVNYLYEEPIEFVQVLRANCYMVVASSVLIGVLLFFFPTLLHTAPQIFIGLMVAYNFYGIMYPKFDF